VRASAAGITGDVGVITYQSLTSIVIAAEFRQRTTNLVVWPSSRATTSRSRFCRTFDYDSMTLRRLTAPRRRQSAGISCRFAERVGV
jgi:hypothetical protein